MEPIKLTQYSHGAGCGCKIAPKVLEQILSKNNQASNYKDLLVGYEHKDDAAVLDLLDGTAIISTTDFFMPIVDDPFDFGQIASVNAISDVYAMGGQPLMAIAILGWPVNQLDIAYAGQVIDGAKHICSKAGIPLAGGHSIDSPEPIFGLAVTGRVNIERLKTNAGAKAGDLLYLTKGLGVGILTTAEKKSLLKPEHKNLAKDSMLRLNQFGFSISDKAYIHAITDVTGFGLLGHLLEMCDGSNLAAQINFEKIPCLDFEAISHYVEQKAIPGGTHRNLDSYGNRVKVNDGIQKFLLADPQTSGGLLIAVSEESRDEFENFARANGLDLQAIGMMQERNSDFVIRVN